MIIPLFIALLFILIVFVFIILDEKKKIKEIQQEANAYKAIAEKLEKLYYELKNKYNDSNFH